MLKLKLIGLLIGLTFWNCGNPTQKDAKENETVDKAEIQHLTQPDWVKNAVIYELNTRQFSDEGTFAKVEEALPRIKELGVDIVWFMPIHEIGVERRKEGLGSYYSVKDYRSINHEFGNKEDFKSVVDKAHSLGMKVIIDWVPNHTAWDHAWITEHPEYYTKNEQGEIIDPTNPDTGESWGWTDVADLNYDNKDLWEAMHQDMAYWVTEFDIDGFRCDVAGEVPNEFWKFNNEKLNAIKPLFMLAEADKYELFQYFNMLYGWEFMHLMNDISEGKKPIQEVNTYMKNHKKEDLYMYFTTNHDENTWNNAPMKYGENEYNFSVLVYLLGGMPMIYCGQEGNLNHKVAFFTKDIVDWGNMEGTPFYQKMDSIYINNNVIWNGINYGDYEAIASPENTLCFSIANNKEKIVTLQNYGETDEWIDLQNIIPELEKAKDILNNEKLQIEGSKVLVKTKSSLLLQ